jgi:hypothetical protein
MSLFTMVSLASAHSNVAGVAAAGDEGNRQQPAQGGGGGGQSRLDSAMQKITAFIPSEVVGIYIAVFGILAPAETDNVMKWWIFGICAGLLIPFFIGIGYLAKKKKREPIPTVPVLLTLLVCALIAFAAWACALPDTPFQQVFGDSATRYGGGAVIVLAAVLYKIAELFDAVPARP